jgi:hypothetical protein
MQAVATTDWQQEARTNAIKRQQKAGYIELNETGDTVLTEAGKQRVAKLLDRLPDGYDVLIELAVFESHGISVDLL